MTAAPDFPIRDPGCSCGSNIGYITEAGAQDVVRCRKCNKFQYNAPRSETGKPVRHVSSREGIKPSQRIRIMLRANGRCELCGRDGRERELHVGHLLSIKDGLGFELTETQLTVDENLAIMCDECNLGLGTLSVPLWVVYRILIARTIEQGHLP